MSSQFIDCCPAQGEFIADIDHNPGMKGSLGGPDVPVILTHGAVMYLPRARAGQEQRWRLATGLEHFAFQGFLMHEPCGPFGLSRRKEVLEGLSEREKKRLAGNGMHLVTQTSFIYYTLAHVIKGEPSTGSSAQPAFAGGSAGENHDAMEGTFADGGEETQL